MKTSIRKKDIKKIFVVSGSVVGGFVVTNFKRKPFIVITEDFICFMVFLFPS